MLFWENIEMCRQNENIRTEAVRVSLQKKNGAR